ncbi:MAG TPA: CDP-alcohol phosphatidyltransferase family protein [Polyangia bacterium]|nr:CDP-alcohol phosphatidyltransferase family protein [Polyangia bacterium]
MRITANQVTTLRLLLMPIVGVMIYGDVRTRIWGVVIGTLIGLTDTVDGYLARKHGPTVLGSLLDPVADKIFIVVCYACFADRGGIAWWIAAAIFSRELLVTVLRSSLELGGRRLPSSGVAKLKTWIQMIGFGFLVLIPILGGGLGLPILFGSLIAFALLALATGRFKGIARRGFQIGVIALLPFLAVSFAGAQIAETLLLVVIVGITWYSAIDYLRAGLPAVARAPSHRSLHGLRLAAGGLLPIVVMAAVATHRLPIVALIVLLSSDMARGALDNFAANQGVADFSWAASLGAELVLLVVALLAPTVGPHLAVVGAGISVIETLRSLIRYLRAPSGAPESAVRLRAPLKGADAKLEAQPPEPVVER